MTYEMQVAQILRTIIAVGAIWAALRFVLRPTLLAWFRGELFQIRRELFLLMARGHVRASDPAYLRFRNTLNGMLLLAEKMSATVVLMSVLFGRRHSLEMKSEFEAAIDQLEDRHARKKIRQLDQRLSIALLRHLLLSAPTMWVLLFLLMLRTLITAGIRAGLRAIFAGKKNAKQHVVVRSITFEAHALGERRAQSMAA